MNQFVRSQRFLEDFDPITTVFDEATGDMSVLTHFHQRNGSIITMKSNTNVEHLNESGDVSVSITGPSSMTYTRNDTGSDNLQSPGEKEGRVKKTRWKKYNRRSDVRSVITTDDNTAASDVKRYESIAQYLMQSSPNDDDVLRGANVIHNRRVLGIMTAKTYACAGGSGHVFTNPELVVSIVRQTKLRPPRAVCINFKSSSRIPECTCNAMVGVEGAVSEVCSHESFCEGGIKSLISQVMEKDSCFGKQVERDTANNYDSFPCLMMEKTGSGRGPGVRKGRNDWELWITFDTIRNIFVPVVKVSEKPYQCQVCRAKSGVPCMHETSCAETAGEKEHSEDNRGGAVDADSLLENEGDTVIQDLSETVGRRTRERKRKQFKFTNVQRSLVMCDREVKNTVELTKAIESAAERKEKLVLRETGRVFRSHCGELHTERDRRRKRKVTLHTLTHGSIKMHVMDWICRICNKKVCYTGMLYAIFPCRRSSAFTVELMYIWIRAVCMQGISYRDSYKLVRAVATAPSVRSKYESDESFLNSKYSDLKRRCANDVFRDFVSSLHVSTDRVTSTLFSCKECEQPLSEADKVELGLKDRDTERDPQIDANNLKRFNAVAIDGTAAGILGSLPEFIRNETKLKLPQGITRKTKMLQKKVYQNSLTEMCKIIKKTMTLNIKKRCSTTSMEEETRCCISSTMEDGEGKLKSLTKSQIQYLRSLIEEDPCFCDVTRATHTQSCMKMRKKTANVSIPNEVRYLLRACFHLEEEVQRVDVEDESGSEEADDVEREGAGNPQDAPFWQTVLSGAEVVQDENEPSTSRNGDQPPQPTVIEEDDATGTTTRQTGNIVTTDNASSTVKDWWAYFCVPSTSRLGQVGASLLDVVQFLLTEHVALVYISPLRLVGENEEDGYDASELFDRPGTLHTSCLKIAKQSLDLHDSLSIAFRKFGTCTHLSESEVLWPCAAYRDRLGEVTSKLAEVNPIMARFGSELLMSGEDVVYVAKEIALRVGDCLTIHVQYARDYFDSHDTYISKECEDYWKNYGSILLHNLGDYVQSPEQTGICFPGRSRCRPGFFFDTKETHHCNKRYNASWSHTHGLMTVQCTCSNPKIIGYMIMTKPESTAIAGSSVVTHFPIPPRTIFYDNACNLFASMLSRIPWFLKLAKVVVDRFHYKGHKCCSFFDPDAYSKLDVDRTTSAESFNARIERAIHHMRYLSGSNLFSFLQVRFALLNLNAIYMQEKNKTDLEDEDVEGFFKDLIDCNCDVCHLSTRLQQYQENAAELLHHNSDIEVENDEVGTDSDIDDYPEDENENSSVDRDDDDDVG